MPTLDPSLFDATSLATIGGVLAATMLIVAAAIKPMCAGFSDSKWYALIINIATFGIAIFISVCAQLAFNLVDSTQAIWNGVIAGFVAIGSHQVLRNTVTVLKGQSPSN